MQKKFGQFITLEGVEGTGKSTNRAFIADYLRTQNIELLETREPGGTELSEQLRELLLQPRQKTMNVNAELMMMFASRAQLLQEVIVPNLNAGVWVLCDRFTDSTYAYQGGGRQMNKDTIATLENIVLGGLKPDLTFILDLPVETGLQRAAQRGQLDRFESETHDFFDAVRRTYLDLVDVEPQRCKLIDASQPLEQVQMQIQEQLDVLLDGHRSKNGQG